MTSPLRNLPSVERVLTSEPMQALSYEFCHEMLADAVRECIQEAREAALNGRGAPSLQEIARQVVERVRRMGKIQPTPVINATGVVIHTNLGRAPLSDAAMAAMDAAAKGYSNLEIDLESGRRGSRQAHLQRLLNQLTGAEASLLVNNNAAAVLLGLSAVAAGKEVIVSRGEAVEIGGGFRIPDVLEQSGATLVEVGTTNRTYARDYEAAIMENTGALLKVHASNFKVVGFTHAPEIAEFVELGRKYDIPVLHDVGSGCLLDTRPFGLSYEPRPQDSVGAGADLVFFSGDKLLGGPQGGIVVGTKDMVGLLARHPLARAFRIDKMSLAATTATLLHYVKEEALRAIPVWRMISATGDDVRERATAWAESIGGGAAVERAKSTIGGGSLPGESLDSWVVSIPCDDVTGGATGLAARLRGQSPPVVARIEDERVMMDPRTVLPDQDDQLLTATRAALRGI